MKIRTRPNIMTSLNGTAGDVYLISQVDSSYYYSLNGGAGIELTFPVTVANSNPTAGVVKVLFSDGITLTTSNSYFEVGSDGIQFGDTLFPQQPPPQPSLPIITVTAANYPGLVKNGTVSSNGHSKVYIYNVAIAGGDGGDLVAEGGWIGQAYFGNGATENYVIACYSFAPITADQCGGIMGASLGYSLGSSISVIGCNSAGAIGFGSGGIVGQLAATDGSVFISECSSAGIIAGNYAGGIVGGSSGVNSSSSLLVTKCYSVGEISGDNAGGIIGGEANNVTVEASYSTGIVSGSNSGGIVGSTYSNFFASNCYAVETNLLIGSGSGNLGNCYGANGSWDDSTARDTLIMSAWISKAVNTPFILNAFGGSPYTQTIIANNQLVHSTSQTINVGASTDAALLVLPSFATYSIIDINGGTYPTFSIDTDTGAITAGSGTLPNTYAVRVLFESPGAYITTTFNVTVVSPPPPTPAAPTSARGKGYDFELYNEQKHGDILVRERLQQPNLRFNSFAEYMKYTIARASLR